MAPLGEVFKQRLQQVASAALARTNDLRRFIEVGEYAAAMRFARRYSVSPLVYPDARGANLGMLPSWVDPRAGLVVDLGANEGEWSANVLRVFPDVEVLAVEPGEEPLGILRSRLGDRPNVTVDVRAVTDAAGSTRLYRTQSSVFASLLEPRDELRELYPESPVEVVGTSEVGTVTLDELVGDRDVSILKLDVQGGELAVLRGGSATLARTAAVLVEVLFLPHYEGDATFGVLHGAMTGLGFTLMDLSRPERVGEGPALWSDACYVRKVRG